MIDEKRIAIANNLKEDVSIMKGLRFESIRGFKGWPLEYLEIMIEALEQPSLEDMKERVEEWLDITGCIPKGTSWYYELLAFFDHPGE